MSPLVKHLSFVTRSASAFFISCFLIMDFYRVVCRMFFISISLIFLASTPVKITSEFQMFNSVVNFFFNYYYFKFTILYWFCHIKMNPPWVYTCSPSWPPPPPPTPYHPSGSSQCSSSSKPPVSCIQPGLAICFEYDIIHVLMPFSQIILPSLSHRVQKTALYICVSFAVLHTVLSLPSF